MQGHIARETCCVPTNISCCVPTKSVPTKSAVSPTKFPEVQNACPRYVLPRTLSVCPPIDPQKHGEVGRLAYPFFHSQGLPLGSDAIECSIRQVRDLRLKGNGIFWCEANAESMLQFEHL